VQKHKHASTYSSLPIRPVGVADPEEQVDRVFRTGGRSVLSIQPPHFSAPPLYGARFDASNFVYILTGSHTVLCLATAGYVAAAKIMRGPAYLVAHLALLPPTVSHVPLLVCVVQNFVSFIPVVADGISEGTLPHELLELS